MVDIKSAFFLLPLQIGRLLLKSRWDRTDRGEATWLPNSHLHNLRARALRLISSRVTRPHSRVRGTRLTQKKLKNAWASGSKPVDSPPPPPDPRAPTLTRALQGWSTVHRASGPFLSPVPRAMSMGGLALREAFFFFFFAQQSYKK